MARNTATGIKAARLRRRDGFTIIELLVVMTLVIILASISMVQYRNSQTRAQEAVLKANLVGMRDAMDQFYADKNKWPSDLAELVSEGYIREVPTDPITGSKDTWQTKQAEPDPNNPASAGGIDDVHSGSDRNSLDGTPYSEWD
jgi:general secretion pathway protein G